MEDSSRSICVPPPLSSPNPKERKNVVVILDPQVVFPPPLLWFRAQKRPFILLQPICRQKEGDFSFLRQQRTTTVAVATLGVGITKSRNRISSSPREGGGREALVCPPAAGGTFEPGSFSHLDFPSLSFLPCNALLLIWEEGGGKRKKVKASPKEKKFKHRNSIGTKRICQCCTQIYTTTHAFWGREEEKREGRMPYPCVRNRVVRAHAKSVSSSPNIRLAEI